MAVFSPTESDQLELQRLVFHVVGPDDAELRILPEIDPAEFAEFFLARLRESDSGNTFHFEDGSETLADLRAIQADDDEFVSGSERLARRFQDLHSGRTSRGVFMVMRVVSGDERFFALVKYDHEEVLHYAVRHGRGPDADPTVVLKRLRDTFVQSRKALQKCAIARLTGDGEPDVSVVDRSTGGNRDITDYFREFLGVRRSLTETELTRRVEQALVATAEAHRYDMPEERARSVRRTVRQALQRATGFDEDTMSAIVADIFGAQEPDSPIIERLQQELQRKAVGTESFNIDPEAFPPVTRRRIRTTEGIEVTFPDDLAENVRVSEDGRTITITTQRIEEEDDITGRRR